MAVSTDSKGFVTAPGCMTSLVAQSWTGPAGNVLFTWRSVSVIICCSALGVLLTSASSSDRARSGNRPGLGFVSNVPTAVVW